ncbi:3-oxoadipate enol-lactonase [Streptomyces sp. A7024]|uniref:3-oxoadipate enol-lactonase n=1 Tax=Streptomyces coryli TaxID=1128680 RepID=A0A6G4U0F9_9ACTN|nr:3-oxoadipate enol-lactonase [Streptomyces coryli]NGN65634.1 3-oxoadipate enol-lactonase [Streptomyces coryli]
MTDLLHHTTDGRADAPALLLGPSLGTSVRLWDAQLPALARGHRVIRYDLPGHGDSPAARLTEPSVPHLAGLVLELADALGIDRFRYAGVSLGGAIGTWLAAHHPDRVESLALLCTSADFGDPSAWRERAARVRTEGVGWLAESAPDRWFTPGYEPSAATASLIADQRGADPAGYAACCEALATCDLNDDMGAIAAPTLVLAGRQDRATPPDHARRLADGIPRASLVELDGAAHLALAEQPQRVLRALIDHFDDSGPNVASSTRTAADAHHDGMTVRREVLGNAHVDRAQAATTPFTAPFQDLITRYAWGEIWTRPGLDRRTRSCITLTALIARGHHEELAMHVRAARTNGLTAAEIQEVLLQSAIYCGVPAANSAFAIADRVLAEERPTEEKP